MDPKANANVPSIINLYFQIRLGTKCLKRKIQCLIQNKNLSYKLLKFKNINTRNCCRLKNFNKMYDFPNKR